MQIHEFIKIGSNHKNFCEDFSLNIELDENQMIFGVFDGCSSGKDSHFATTLIAKIVKNVAVEIFNKEKDNDFLLKIIYETALQLKKTVKALSLGTNEILSTIILLWVDKKENLAEIIAIGDGFISINGKNTTIEQNNTPKYLAYYLNEIYNYKSFKKVINEISFQAQTANIQDITISTDGILSFENFDADSEKTSVIDYLTKDLFLINNKAMLGRKVNILKNKYSLINQDDLGIIRIVNI